MPAHPGPPGGRAANRSRLVASFLAALGVAAVLLVAGAPAVDAHPLGNFTINRYARIEVSAGTVRIYYVLDEAEIPAFQERDEITADRDGFLARRVADIAAGLRLEVDGRRLGLEAVSRSLDQPEGQAGLDTLRVVVVYEAALADGPADATRSLTFTDGNGGDRPGWREVLAVARGDAAIASSTVPSEDASDELRSYPADLLQAPLDLRTASVTFTPGREEVTPLGVEGTEAAPSRAGGRFAELVTRDDVGPVVLVSMLGVAALIGAGHALLPGHGKTVMAAYLVGTKGRPVDAVLLGVIVSLMHTASVLVLGLVLFRVNESAPLDRLYPVLTVASGVLAAGLGGWLLRGRLRHLRAVRSNRAAIAEASSDPPSLTSSTPGHPPDERVVGAAHEPSQSRLDHTDTLTRSSVDLDLDLSNPSEPGPVHGDRGNHSGATAHDHASLGPHAHDHHDHDHDHDRDRDRADRDRADRDAHDDHAHAHAHAREQADSDAHTQAHAVDHDHDRHDHDHADAHGHDHGRPDAHDHALVYDHASVGDAGLGQPRAGSASTSGDARAHDDPQNDAESNLVGARSGPVSTGAGIGGGHRHAPGLGHEHGHQHGHGPGRHSHDLPDDVAPLSRRGLVVLATSGGIVPSPTAVVVVVSAFSLGRAALGLSLIAAFSVGLATTLTAVGLALVYGRRVLERRWPGRTLDRLPLVGAGALIVLGAGLAIQGLIELGR